MFMAGKFAPKPVEVALHETGLWALRLLLITLTITPLRHLTGRNGLIQFRRMLGVGALGYGLVHLGLYIVDQKFDLAKVVSEIVLRFYLTIGTLSLVAMIALGATSFDRVIRRMGAVAWNRLHLLTYPLTLLGLWHGALQSKINVSEAAVMTGIFFALMLFRLLRRRIGMPMLLAAALVPLTMLATAIIEAGWYALATGIPAMRVWEANIMLDLQPRPALVAGLVVLALPLFAGLVRLVAPARPAIPRSI